uniref:Coiled-coil domain-containing protein 93 n=1 Tax=Haptolina ericina TaxID=156174 RepID=A0A7S3BSN1_9EUKA
MKCAVPLQAHQLQGLDVEVLYPLVQWLVKQVYGRREEIESTMRRMSVAQFDQHCRAVPHLPPPTTKTDSLRSLYAPQRRCRLKETGEKTPMVHAQHVMLEYVGIKKGWTALKALHRMKVGLKGAAGALGSAQPGGTQGGESTDDLAKALSKVLVSGGADDEGDADAATGEEAEEAGEGSLEESDAGFGEKDLEKKMIAQLVGMGASDIHQHREDFAQKSDALMATGGMAQVYRIRSERDAMERRIEYENQQLQRELSQVAEASETAGAAADAAAATQAEVEKHGVKQQKMIESVESSGVDHQGESGDALRQIERVVALSAELTEKAKALQKEHAELMESRRQTLRQQLESPDLDIQKLDEIDRLLISERQKAQKMRQFNGQKGQKIASLQRQLDEVPNRAELVQYERRFRELYAQVAGKHEETKKYFNLYNTLEERKTYLSKEVSLINSINGNFAKLKAATKDKAPLADSIEGLTKSVAQSLEKVKQRLMDETASKDALQAAHDKLMDKERKYYKLIREMQVELQRSEELS